MSYDPNMLTGVYYDNNPVTGEPGKWRLFPDQGWVNLDPNAPTDVYWNERGQNYMGELGQYYTVNPNTGEVSIDDDGNGRWYYSGMMGWVNTKPAEVQPDPGPVSFGNFDGSLAGPTGQGQTTTSNNTSSSTNTGSSTGTSGGTDSTTGETQGDTSADLTDSSMGESGGGMMGGGGYQGGVQGLDYSSPSIAPVQATPKIDYVKMLNRLLAADVLGGMMTGRGY